MSRGSAKSPDPGLRQCAAPVLPAVPEAEAGGSQVEASLGDVAKQRKQKPKLNIRKSPNPALTGDGTFAWKDQNTRQPVCNTDQSHPVYPALVLFCFFSLSISLGTVLQNCPTCT